MQDLIHKAKCIATVVLNTATSSLSTSAWTQITSALSRLPVTVQVRLEIFNSTGSTIALSTGQSGQENGSILPYTVLPGGSDEMVPLDIPAGARLSAKALDAASNSGVLVINIFG